MTDDFKSMLILHDCRRILQPLNDSGDADVILSYSLFVHGEGHSVQSGMDANDIVDFLIGMGFTVLVDVGPVHEKYEMIMLRITRKSPKYSSLWAEHVALTKQHATLKQTTHTMVQLAHKASWEVLMDETTIFEHMKYRTLRFFNKLFNRKKDNTDS